ncbi:MULTISPECIES: DUF4118 domain-containing protein [Arthrobacter]|uniref:histidine kinase n=2 Tax=Arthrobacter TaxID=1663 RepID=A0ABU9KL23_9MICC|nr:DUF4118 domain-containing protein [Arthrobacter sp. YJM1]MDP5227502.1 DUF4118 domain-containing protein [Arthrobacter sp. YJM1]
MKRGRLRVFLGAAPGVGKTYAMLEEAHRLRDAGEDVVVAIALDHGRRQTARLLDGLELIPQREVTHRGTVLREMDLDAVLERRPQLAVVDEYAHSNAPGSRHAKRWEDVEELLEAGVDVLSTVNVQHLASLHDVVEAITGTRQQETVPDAVVRRADQIELIDIPPELLRQRLSQGNVYPAENVDAALANYFRLGNLSALREIALIWLADRVEEGLAQYRERQGIAGTWPARERIVVGLTGGPEGPVLIRRAARILARVNDGDLLAVHVRQADGLDDAAMGGLGAQQRLVEDLGGRFVHVSGEDVSTALLDYARGVNATQIVIGVSRHSRFRQLLGGGVSNSVVRGSGDIDVHLVNHPFTGRQATRAPAPSLGRIRLTLGFVLALVGPPLITLLLTPFTGLDLATHVLAHLCVVITVAFVGGLKPAVPAAVLDSLLLNYFVVPPVGTLTISDPQSFFALMVFLGVAIAVSLVVGLSARRSVEARRARAEAATLSELASSSLASDQRPAEFLTQLTEEFGLESATLFTRAPAQDDDAAWEPLASSGTGSPQRPEDAGESEQLAPGALLAWTGRVLSGAERRLLKAFESHLLALLERDRLALSLADTVKLAEGNRIRTSLLQAASHDLRTPLAGIGLAVTALRRQRGKTTPEEEEEMLETIESCNHRLESLIANLLDMSRISGDAVAVLHEPVSWLEVVPEALSGVPGGSVRVELAPNLPPVDADRGLLERALANMVENSVKHAPGSEVVLVATPGGLLGPVVGGRPASELRVVDHGGGVARERVAEMFQPFQRLEERTSGLGLGLAVARGFVEAMGGEVVAEDTPGGGLTMVVRLPLYAGPHGT